MDDEQLTPELDRKMLELLKEAALHDYPNPERIGCPGRDFLNRLVNDRRSIDLSDPALDHVARCSPCFQEFVEIKDQANRAKISRRAAIAAGGTILIAGAAETVRRASTHSKSQDSDNERYAPADFDMSLGSAERGATENPSQTKPTPDLPRKRLDLSITLPFASPEATYEVQVMGPGGATGLKASGAAHLLKGTTILRVKLDLTKLQPDTYTLGIRRIPYDWTSQPVQIR
jgi:hypothetical protein